MSDNGIRKPNSNGLPVGYRFNEFEIKEVIGEGGFGIVYRAYDHQLERTIAIKEYMPSTLVMRNDDLSLSLRGERFSKTFQAGLHSFIQEARLLARFSHPGLLHVLRFWEQNGTAYMGTQFYTGTTLKNFHQEHPGKINETWIRRLLPPLFSAINTLHKAGYLHCDISLDNIQIQDNQLPVLLDFGSARKEIGNLSDETEIMLKPGFAPIELYTDNNDGDQGAWTDIYALGAVLHTLIVGTPPPVSVVRSIEDSYQPLMELRPQGYSLELLYAVDRALALRPEDRPQNITELADLLRLPIAMEAKVITPPAVIPENRPVPTPAPMPVVNELPAHNRSAFYPLLAGVGIVALLAAGAFVWFSSNSGGHTPAPPVAQTPPPPDTPTPPTEPASPGQTASNTNPAPETQPPTTTAPDSTNVTAPPAGAPIARVYFRLQAGERVSMNGQTQSIYPDGNGYASLNLPAGDYQLEILNDGHTPRRQQITINAPGTWLIAPAG
ncbi:serine/threonine protein kinase [Enterobacillus tribolii]|uniref:Protein kinase domain-containing protein n=1 Tax=Enterobacillus tribolii TaxID=1487935 RepID=A0A370Q6Y0_9GAMM|nr:serine/threonine-protein kinase [Enterobacillus tribolii]MBW7984923.1 serine/threonine protein kinase [Enterobacillus tribolii]RDK84135.1 hypothetical protein C8D90_11454 [Enterobacillus tribolii]